MRIMHVIKDLEPGGIQSLLSDIFENKDCIDSTLALFSMGNGRLKEKLKKNCGSNYYEAQRSLPLDFNVVKNIKKAIKSFNPDIIHTHHTAEMIHAWLAVRNNKKVIKVHTHHVSPKVCTVTDTIITKWLEPKFDALITPTHALKNEMMHSGYPRAAHYFVVNNGISEARTINKLSKSECRRILNIHPDHFVIGMAGTFFNNIRDQETLCKALPLINSVYKPFEVVFVGAGKSKYFRKTKQLDYCKSLVKQNGFENCVHFLKHTDPVSHFYGALDVYVHSSKHDTFGLAPLEALLNGLPTIVTDIEPFRELFDNNANVCFFPVSDQTALANNINDVFSKLNNMPKTENDSQLPVEKKFLISSHLKNLEELYNKLLNNRLAG